ncbi:hypothetical protein LTR93_012071, partial [Exophiala xenobiotica]
IQYRIIMALLVKIYEGLIVSYVDSLLLDGYGMLDCLCGTLLGADLSQVGNILAIIGRMVGKLAQMMPVLSSTEDQWAGATLSYVGSEELLMT